MENYELSKIDFDLIVLCLVILIFVKIIIRFLILIWSGVCIKFLMVKGEEFKFVWVCYVCIR